MNFGRKKTKIDQINLGEGQPYIEGGKKTDFNSQKSS